MKKILRESRKLLEYGNYDYKIEFVVTSDDPIQFDDIRVSRSLEAMMERWGVTVLDVKITKA